MGQVGPVMLALPLLHASIPSTALVRAGEMLHGPLYMRLLASCAFAGALYLHLSYFFK
jgi:hypothetical protein